MKRDLMMHSAMSFLRGFPMLSCGDEIVQLNGWEYKEDPDRVEDSRNLHRSPFNWENAAKRKQAGTLQKQMWDGLKSVREMRDDPAFAPEAWVTTWDAHNDAVLAVVRHVEGRTVLGLFNFSSARQIARLIRTAISSFLPKLRWSRTRFAWSKNNYYDFDLRLLRECV